MIVRTKQETEEIPVLTKKDFASESEPRWCPGCGDYSILAQMQKMLSGLGIARENLVFVSGIGCSSRFPYYMNTYGFHSIHGRAPTLATGLKVMRPELTVFVITGDGDGLSIGGNHFLHVMRRNVDLNLILFNNQIYGLTKGQYSPTSEFGKTTKSSPMGSIENPLNPVSVALAAEATFVARSFDTDPTHLTATLEQAARHQGISFVEVFQNCNIFNDGAFRAFTDKPVRHERMLFLEQGQPMLFGENHDKGIALSGTGFGIIAVQDGDTSDVLIHDAGREDPMVAQVLARMAYPEMPVPVGVIRDVQRPTYDALLTQQIAEAREQRGDGDLATLIRGDNTWLVE